MKAMRSYVCLPGCFVAGGGSPLPLPSGAVNARSISTCTGYYRLRGHRHRPCGIHRAQVTAAESTADASPVPVLIRPALALAWPLLAFMADMTATAVVACMAVTAVMARVVVVPSWPA